MTETTAWRSHCQFITFITFLFTVNVIRQMAPLFSKVDSNKLWHDVQHEENMTYAQFGKDLFNISKVIGRKKVAQFFFDSQCIWRNLKQSTCQNCVCCMVSFYPRDAMLARVIAITTCLSVCPSRAGIVSKRRKLAAWFLYHLVAPRL